MRRFFWTVVEFLSNTPMPGWYVPPKVLEQMEPADPGLRFDPRELDEWLASVLDTGPDL